MKNVFKSNPLKIKEDDGLLVIAGKAIAEGLIVGTMTTVGVLGAFALIGHVVTKKEDSEKKEEITEEEVVDALIAND